MRRKPYEAVVIGGSSGSLEVLKKIIPSLHREIEAAVIVVYHVHADSGDVMVKLLAKQSQIEVKQPVDKEVIRAGVVFMAPPNYHLLVEWDRSFALSIDAPVNYSRPSIDVLFESAADVYGDKLVGIILSGANTDGSLGLKHIKDKGGLTVVQAPESAEVATMPRGALSASQVDYVLVPEEIGAFVNRMTR